MMSCLGNFGPEIIKESIKAAKSVSELMSVCTDRFLGAFFNDQSNSTTILNSFLVHNE